MNEAFRRAGVLYGKLGLTTSSALIESRYSGIEAAAKALTVEQLPELLLVLFGKTNAAKVDFLEHFKNDLTFDVRPTDKEAALLATAIADYAMTEDIAIGGQVALLVTTAAVGGMRPPAVPSDVLSIADATLTAKQEESHETPRQWKQVAVPAALSQAIETIKGQPQNHQNLPTILPAISTAFEQLSQYLTSFAQRSTAINSSLLAHIAKLEEETDTHWWVVGGWSAEKVCPFRDLGAIEASVQAGWELAGKTSSQFGLYAAPALLNIVLERGRESLSTVALAAVSKAPELSWRSSNFETVAGGPLAPLLPTSTMFGLSAAAADEDDWKPAFVRKTGIDPAATIAPLNLAVQVYRERLAHKLLKV